MIENQNDFSHEPDDEQGETAAGTHQFVTFLVGDEVFAVDMAPVQEIIRVPSVVRVPLAPYSLVGLASLRGRVWLQAVIPANSRAISLPNSSTITMA